MILKIIINILYDTVFYILTNYFFYIIRKDKYNNRQVYNILIYIQTVILY